MHLIANADLARALHAVQARAPEASASVCLRAIGDAAGEMLAEPIGLRAPNWLTDLVARATTRVQTTTGA